MTKKKLACWLFALLLLWLAIQDFLEPFRN